VSAGNAAAQYHDFGGRHARDAAQQHSEAAIGLLQAVGAHLHRHASSDFTHRRQQRSDPSGAVTVSYAIAVAPEASSASACSRSAAKCRYVNKVCPLRSCLHSASCNSLTFTMRSVLAKMSWARCAMTAPAD